MDARHQALRRLVDGIRDANDRNMPLDIRGGQTKRFYGGVPRGQAFEVGELRGITSYEPTELVVTALAGTPLAELEGVLAERGQCLPFEPPRYAAGGTLGGMVAAGFAGPARANVGPLRDFVLGITVLNGVGESLTFGGQVIKNVAGYDVSRLLCGSFGILGVICEISLKVMPVAPASMTLCFDRDEAAALDQLNRWAGVPFPLNGSSWYRDRLCVRLSGARAAVGDVQRRVGGTALEPAAADAWWRDIRDHRHPYFDISDAALERGECLWKLSLPDTAAPVSLPGEQFIEWGGSQRWLRGDVAAAIVRAAATQHEGHATLVRAADKSPGVFPALTPALMRIHQRLKHTFDPAGIFNPGRLYADL